MYYKGAAAALLCCDLSGEREGGIERGEREERNLLNRFEKGVREVFHNCNFFFSICFFSFSVAL